MPPTVSSFEDVSLYVVCWKFGIVVMPNPALNGYGRPAKCGN